MTTTTVSGRSLIQIFNHRIEWLFNLPSMFILQPGMGGTTKNDVACYDQGFDDGAWAAADALRDVGNDAGADFIERMGRERKL